jgi:hypothetical protein
MSNPGSDERQEQVEDVTENPAEYLKKWLDEEAYIGAMNALGETPILDL